MEEGKSEGEKEGERREGGKEVKRRERGYGIHFYDS